MDLPEPIYDVALRLTKRCDLDTHMLARRAGVGFEWLRKFRAGKVKDPRIRSLQRLHDFLVIYETDRRQALESAEAISKARSLESAAQT